MRDSLLYLTFFSFLFCLFIAFKNILRNNHDRREHVLLGSLVCLCVIICTDYIITSYTFDTNLFVLRNAAILVLMVFLSFILLQNKKLKKDIFISKNIAYHLTLGILIFIEITLFLSTGYIIISFVPEIKKNIVSLFILLGLLSLYGTVFSEIIRTEVWVFIDKNFYKSKYDYRRQWLHFTESLFSNTSLNDLFDVIVQRFSLSIGAKSASLWLYNPAYGAFTQHIASNCATSDLKIEKNNSLIKFFIEKRWIYDKKSPFEEIEKENRKFFDTFCPSLAVPLQTGTDTIGFILLGESNTQGYYNYEDYDLLKTIAKQATSTIMNTQLTQELSHARQMVLMGKIASFIVHDLKNLSSAFSLMTEQFDSVKENKIISQMLMQASEDINSLIKKIKSLDPVVIVNPKPVKIDHVIKDVIEATILQENIKIIYRTIAVIVMVDREGLKKVLTNLILNASDAINGEGVISIDAYQNDKKVCIDVADTGCGISQEFIDKQLFRPFQTTKSKGMGIGLYQCKTIVEAHGGKLRVRRNGRKGTVFSIELDLKEGKTMTL